MKNNKNVALGTTNKTKINWKKLVKRYIARPTAYMTVFVLASYGMRQVLRSLEDSAAVVVTTLSVLALVYIMFDND